MSAFALYCMCIWIFIPCVVFFIYRKRNPIQKVHTRDASTNNPSESDDVRSIPQLQQAKSKFLERRRLLLAQKKQFQQNIVDEKSLNKIIMSLILRTSRLQINRLYYLKLRLDAVTLEITSLDEEIQRIDEKIRTHSQKEKASSFSSEYTSQTFHDENAESNDERFIQALVDELSRRSAKQFGFGLREKDKAKEIFVAWASNIQQQKDHGSPRGYVIEEEVLASHLLLPSPNTPQWVEVSDEEEAIKAMQKEINNKRIR